MSRLGNIAWADLTVPNADQVSSFYEDVLGWKKQGISMGEYDDYVMMLSDEETPAAGICHAKGVNKDLPPQWLIYIEVEDLDKSLAACIASGGKVHGEKRSMGKDGKHYCLIQDPAGAFMMILG